MTSLTVTNDLASTHGRGVLVSSNGGIDWQTYNTGAALAPMSLANLPELNHCFRFEGSRISNSALVVQIAQFTHAIECVDVISKRRQYVLLRFIPKSYVYVPDSTIVDLDIHLHCTTQRVYPIPVVNSKINHPLDLICQSFKPGRSVRIRKYVPDGLVFASECSCDISGHSLLIGQLNENEIMEMCLLGSRPTNKTEFYVTFKKMPITLLFTDYNNVQHQPHIEARLYYSPGSPETVNVTIVGDEE